MLTLYVDEQRWHAHLRSVVRAHPGIVPVAKGNGYGFGIARLAEIAQQLDGRGLGSTRSRSGRTPRWPTSRPRSPATCWCSPRGGRSRPGRRTTRAWSTPSAGSSDLADLAAAGSGGAPAAGGARAADLDAPARLHARGSCGEAADAPRRARGRGLRAAPADGARAPTSARWSGCSPTWSPAASSPAASSSPTSPTPSWPRSAASYPDFELRPRIGTRLWLGDRGALDVRATVLDVHAGGARRRVRLPRPHRAQARAHRRRLRRHRPRHRARGTHRRRHDPRPRGAGRQGRPRRGRLRPLAVHRQRQAAALRRAAAHAGLDALPPARRRRPAVGDEVDVRVRFTATAFDRIVLT